MAHYINADLRTGFRMRCHDFIIGGADSRNALMRHSEFKSRRVQARPKEC
jgi:hypothetical protein